MTKVLGLDIYWLYTGCLFSKTLSYKECSNEWTKIPLQSFIESCHKSLMAFVVANYVTSWGQQSGLEGITGI